MTARDNNPQRWIRIFKYAVLTAFLLLALRLFTVQCIHHSRLYAQALSQHEIVQELPAPRGRIFDRNMHPLADSLHAESVWLYKPRLDSEKWGEAAVKFASVLQHSGICTLRLLTSRTTRYVSIRTGTLRHRLLDSAIRTQKALKGLNANSTNT